MVFVEGRTLKRFAIPKVRAYLSTILQSGESKNASNLSAISSSNPMTPVRFEFSPVSPTFRCPFSALLSLANASYTRVSVARLTEDHT